MENKHTAVDWLMNQIRWEVSNSNILEKLEKKAKQMEKDQKIDFASKVLNKAECSWTGIVHINESLEDIYNETYGE